MLRVLPFVFFSCPFALFLSLSRLCVSLPLLLSVCPLSCLSSLVYSCVLCGSCGLLFPFPLRTMCKKERARRVGASSLVLLWVCYIFSASLSVASFAFENIHPAPQERWLLNLPPMVFRVSLIARVSPTIAIAFSE